MAGSGIDEVLPASARLRPHTADTSMLLRRRLLAELMPSILHELSQPLTCVMLQHAVCRRAMPSDTASADIALRLAERDARRASSIIETMNLLSSDESEPVAETDLNTLVSRAAELLKRHLYDRHCTIEYHMASLPDARLSPTTAMEAILRAIVVGAQSDAKTASQMSVVTKLDREGQYVQLIFRAVDEAGISKFSTVTSCNNYAPITNRIRSEGGQIGLCGGELIIEFPVAGGPKSRDLGGA